MNWIRANIWRAVALALGGLALALLVQVHGLPIIGGGLLADLDRMTELRTAERDSHRTTKANVRTAQASASAAQAAANLQPAQTSAIIARISDATSPAYYDAVRRYADGMRADGVRAGRAAQCAGGAADLPGTDRAVESADNAADPSEWVSVARADWTLVTAAAAQGYVCARDGQALIAQGAAVAAKEGTEQ